MNFFKNMFGLGALLSSGPKIKVKTKSKFSNSVSVKENIIKGEYLDVFCHCNREDFDKLYSSVLETMPTACMYRHDLNNDKSDICMDLIYRNAYASQSEKFHVVSLKSSQLRTENIDDFQQAATVWNIFAQYSDFQILEMMYKAWFHNRRVEFGISDYKNEPDISSSTRIHQFQESFNIFMQPILARLKQEGFINNNMRHDYIRTQGLKLMQEELAKNDAMDHGALSLKRLFTKDTVFDSTHVTQVKDVFKSMFSNAAIEIDYRITSGGQYIKDNMKSFTYTAFYEEGH